MGWSASRMLLGEQPEGQAPPGTPSSSLPQSQGRQAFARDELTQVNWTWGLGGKKGEEQSFWSQRSALPAVTPRASQSSDSFCL